MRLGGAAILAGLADAVGGDGLIQVRDFSIRAKGSACVRLVS